MVRLELIPSEDTQSVGNGARDPIIEAQVPVQLFNEMGFREGETRVVKPRHACVFVEGAAQAQ
jgi:sulfate transport system ATP-binding protein